MQMKLSLRQFLLVQLLAIAHGARPPKSKYSIKGLGVHGYASAWDEAACRYTSLSVSAHEDVTKTGGSPVPTKYAYLDVDTYNSCTDESITVRVEVPAPALQGSLKNGATVQATFTEGEKCFYDPSVDEYVCVVVPFEGSVSASFTPVGNSYKDRFQNQYASQGYRYKERSVGTSVDATVNFAGTVLDGVSFVPDETYGYVHKYTSGSMEMIKIY